MEEGGDVLDVNFALLLIRLLRQSCEAFLEVLPSGLRIARLTVVILRR